MSVAEPDDRGDEADGSSDGPSLSEVQTWREKHVLGDMLNIFHAINGLINHIYFPKPSKHDILVGRKPSGRTIQLFTLVCIAVIVAAKVWRHMSYAHWSLVILSAFFILAIEGMNTTIEMICDWLEPKYSTHVKAIKDASAGAVLIAAGGVAIIWSLMFWHPR